MITLQSYSYDCANGNIPNQISTPFTAAFADEKVLILDYLSDVSLLDSEIRFNIALYVNNYQEYLNNNSYYYIPFNASTPLATQLDMAFSNIPDSNKLVYAKITFNTEFSFTIIVRFFNTYDKSNFITGLTPNNKKQLLAGSLNANLLQDNLPSAYNSQKYIGLYAYQRTGSMITNAVSYDYLAINPTFLNVGVMSNHNFTLLVNNIASSVFSTENSTKINFKIDYDQNIDYIRFWVIDYTNANNNSISFVNDYNSLWIDTGTVTQSPAGTFNASLTVPSTQFINGNTYYVIAVCYDNTNTVVNSFVSSALTAGNTSFCEPVITSYFRDYLNDLLPSNIITSPYDRIKSIINYESPCSYITNITLSFENNLITANKSGSGFIVSDNNLSVSVSGNTTTITFDFRVLAEWAGNEILFEWVITNNIEVKTIRLYQRIDVREFQDITPVQLIETKIFDLSNNEIAPEDLCFYEDSEFIIETEASDSTPYKQLAIYDNAGEIEEEESFVGLLPQLTSSNLSLVDTDYVANKARFRATIDTFGGILASIAKQLVEFYNERFIIHNRGNSTPDNDNNFYGYITIPISKTVLDIEIIDVFSNIYNFSYKFRENGTPAFDTLPLITKAQLLVLLASRTQDCDIELHYTITEPKTDSSLIVSYLVSGAITPSTLSYNFANTLSSDIMIGFDTQITLTSIVSANPNTLFRVFPASETDIESYGLVTGVIGALNVLIAAQAALGKYVLQIVDFKRTNVTITYTY